MERWEFWLYLDGLYDKWFSDDESRNDYKSTRRELFDEVERQRNVEFAVAQPADDSGDGYAYYYIFPNSNDRPSSTKTKRRKGGKRNMVAFSDSSSQEWREIDSVDEIMRMERWDYDWYIKRRFGDPKFYHTHFFLKEPTWFNAPLRCIKWVWNKGGDVISSRRSAADRLGDQELCESKLRLLRDFNFLDNGIEHVRVHGCDLRYEPREFARLAESRMKKRSLGFSSNSDSTIGDWDGEEFKCSNTLCQYHWIPKDYFSGVELRIGKDEVPIGMNEVKCILKELIELCKGQLVESTSLNLVYGFNRRDESQLRLDDPLFVEKSAEELILSPKEGILEFSTHIMRRLNAHVIEKPTVNSSTSSGFDEIPHIKLEIFLEHYSLKDLKIREENPHMFEERSIGQEGVLLSELSISPVKFNSSPFHFTRFEHIERMDLELVVDEISIVHANKGGSSSRNREKNYLVPIEDEGGYITFVGSFKEPFISLSDPLKTVVTRAGEFDDVAGEWRNILTAEGTMDEDFDYKAFQIAVDHAKIHKESCNMWVSFPDVDMPHIQTEDGRIVSVPITASIVSANVPTTEESITASEKITGLSSISHNGGLTKTLDREPHENITGMTAIKSIGDGHRFLATSMMQHTFETFDEYYDYYQATHPSFFPSRKTNMEESMRKHEFITKGCKNVGVTTQPHERNILQRNLFNWDIYEFGAFSESSAQDTERSDQEYQRSDWHVRPGLVMKDPSVTLPGGSNELSDRIIPGRPVVTRGDSACPDTLPFSRVNEFAVIEDIVVKTVEYPLNVFGGKVVMKYFSIGSLLDLDRIELVVQKYMKNQGEGRKNGPILFNEIKALKDVLQEIWKDLMRIDEQIRQDAKVPSLSLQRIRELYHNHNILSSPLLSIESSLFPMMIIFSVEAKFPAGHLNSSEFKKMLAAKGDDYDH